MHIPAHTLQIHQQGIFFTASVPETKKKLATKIHPISLIILTPDSTGKIRIKQQMPHARAHARTRLSRRKRKNAARTSDGDYIPERRIKKSRLHEPDVCARIIHAGGRFKRELTHRWIVPDVVICTRRDVYIGARHTQCGEPRAPGFLGKREEKRGEEREKRKQRDWCAAFFIVVWEKWLGAGFDRISDVCRWRYTLVSEGVGWWCFVLEIVAVDVCILLENWACFVEIIDWDALWDCQF